MHGCVSLIFETKAAAKIQAPNATGETRIRTQTTKNATHARERTQQIEKSRQETSQHSEGQARSQGFEQQRSFVAYPAQHVSILLGAAHQVRHHLTNGTVGNIFVRAIASSSKGERYVVTHAQQLAKGHPTRCEGSTTQNSESDHG